jgi:hypothetical protein
VRERTTRAKEEHLQAKEPHRRLDLLPPEPRAFAAREPVDDLRAKGVSERDGRQIKNETEFDKKRQKFSTPTALFGLIQRKSERKRKRKR